jgi:hypothetical protein
MRLRNRFVSGKVFAIFHVPGANLPAVDVTGLPCNASFVAAVWKTIPSDREKETKGAELGSRHNRLIGTEPHPGKLTWAEVPSVVPGFWISAETP